MKAVEQWSVLLREIMTTRCIYRGNSWLILKQAPAFIHRRLFSRLRIYIICFKEVWEAMMPALNLVFVYQDESLNLQSFNILAQFNLVHISVTEAWVLLMIVWPALWTVCAAAPYGLSCPLFLDLMFCLWRLTDRVLVLCLSLWAAAQHFVAVCCDLESLKTLQLWISMSSRDRERNRKVTFSIKSAWMVVYSCHWR